MPLTDSACKNAKPLEKPYKMADSQGLFLNVMTNGSKYWRLKYRFLTVGDVPCTCGRAAMSADLRIRGKSRCGMAALADGGPVRASIFIWPKGWDATAVNGLHTALSIFSAARTNLPPEIVSA